mgnify:CR=1 FL=1
MFTGKAVTSWWNGLRHVLMWHKRSSVKSLVPETNIGSKEIQDLMNGTRYAWIFFLFDLAFIIQLPRILGIEYTMESTFSV